MKGEGFMTLFNVHKLGPFIHKQRESEMERRVMMISEGVNVYKLLKDLLWIVHISLENPRQTYLFVLFLSNKQTKDSSTVEQWTLF